MAAFEGLVKLGFVEITQKGYFDRESLEGGLTRIIAADELKERLDELQSNPAIALEPDLSRETILLRNRIDGNRVLVDYEDTALNDSESFLSLSTKSRRVDIKWSSDCFDSVSVGSTSSAP